MTWNLLTENEIKTINAKILGTAPDLPEGALSEATEGAVYDYAETLSQTVFFLARAIAQYHPFEDGNKRTATEAVRVFLCRNGITVTARQMADIAELIGQLADEDPIEKAKFTEEMDKILN